MVDETGRIEPFAVKDSALIAIATGRRAHNLRELRDGVQLIPEGAIYYHFWGGRLRPRFDDPEFNNDFAAWARHSLHDGRTAERLALLDPTEFESTEALRQRMLEVLEECLFESEFVKSCDPGQHFDFMRSQIVVFDTNERILTPEALGDAIPDMSLGSIFYHFIDARRRTDDNIDDFRAWLQPLGERCRGVVERLSEVDPYFSTLWELRRQLAAAFEELHAGGEG